MSPKPCVIGGNSCYGDQILEFARHLAEHGDICDSHDALIARLQSAFGDGSAYGKFPPAEGKPAMPIDGPWRHGSLKGFLSNTTAGIVKWPLCGDAKDCQVDCVAKAIPVTVAFAGQPELLQHVERAVRVTQNNDTAVAYAQAAARVLEACIMGCSSLKEALEKAAHKIAEDSTSCPDGAMPTTQALELVMELLAAGAASYSDLVNALESRPELQLQSPFALVA